MLCAVPEAPPVIPPVTVGADQVYVVPAGTIVAAVGVASVKVVVNDPPLQIDAVCAGITGFGFTDTVTVNEAPVHNEVAGVTV